MAFKPALPVMGANTNYLQYKGVWDMQDLYNFLASFFSRHKFKFYEERYITKHPGPFGPETYHIWKAVRNVEEYYRYNISLWLHLYDTQNVEATGKDGSKRTFTKGRMWIQFRGDVEFDYEKRWEENAFYAHLRNFYHKYVIWKKLQAVLWDNMYYNYFLRLHSMVKERLKLESEAFEGRYFNKMR